jgi:septal ring factor EnvC (AmiA/AmiB activator)
MCKILFPIALFFICTTSVLAQESKEEIQKKQNLLQKEIEQLNKTLTQVKANKKLSLGELSLVQRKIDTRQDLINSLGKDLRRLDNDMYKNSLEIYRLKKERDSLKNEYAQNIAFAYKNRSNYDYLSFLFSATSFNDALKRLTYLKSYNKFRETQVSTILKTQSQIENRNQQLSANKTEKSTTLKSQAEQLTVLEQDRKEKDQVVAKLKSQEKNIAGEIKNKEKTRQKLNAALQAIIKREIAEAKKKAEAEALAKRKAEEARIKAEAEAAAKKKAEENKAKSDAAANNTVSNNSNNNSVAPIAEQKVVKPAEKKSFSTLESTDEDRSRSLSFEANKGNLPWPVSSGYVSIHFGTYKLTDILTGNSDGIEIQVPAGSIVKAVADGVVASVFDLGGEQAVVVRHGKYFTTYSHLASVNVTRNSEVKAGTIVGKAMSAENGEGQVLFMVTNDKGVNMNPELWLRSR